MYPGMEAAQRLPDWAVDGKFVAAGMNAQLESGGGSITGDGMPDYCDVVVEFSFERCEIACIIDAFVKAAREFGRDGLDRDCLVGDGSQDDQQLHRSLRVVRFIHRYFSDERTICAAFRNV